MAIEIREIGSKKELKQFICFPFSLYKNDPRWIPPLIRGELNTLNRKTNPAYDHCDTLFLMAFRDGVPVGRIAGIINHRYIEQWNKKDARFCWFDVINDLEVTRALFRKVEGWAKGRGMERIVGPMGFTTFERQGMLVEGFEEMPTFSGCYNFPYYPEHMKILGFSEEIRYVEYELTVPREVPEKIVRISDLVKKRYGLRIPKASSTRELLPYAEEVFQVINSAYKPLYGFTELTEKQIQYFVKKYFSYVRPEYVSVVLDRQDKVLGFQISLPSLAEAFQKARGRLFPFGWLHLKQALKNSKRIDTLLTGVLPEYQSKGINAVFMTHLTQAAIDGGMQYAESNGELAENIKVQNTWRYFERRQHRSSQLFAREIGPDPIP
jgi:GNAT superfamily N-acetyltransferase